MRSRKRGRRGGVIRGRPSRQEQPGSTSRNLIIAAKYHEAQSLAWPPSVIRSGPRGKYDYVLRVERESRSQLEMDVVKASVAEPIRDDLRTPSSLKEAIMDFFPLLKSIVHFFIH